MTTIKYITQHSDLIRQYPVHVVQKVLYVCHHVMKSKIDNQYVHVVSDYNETLINKKKLWDKISSQTEFIIK